MPEPGAAADSQATGAGAGPSSGTLVELAFKWGKQEIRIHAEPEETVQVRADAWPPDPARVGGGPRRPPFHTRTRDVTTITRRA